MPNNTILSSVNQPEIYSSLNSRNLLFARKLMKNHRQPKSR